MRCVWADIPLLWYINGMDTELDLRKASRETQLSMIVQQEATIAQLQQQVAALEARRTPEGRRECQATSLCQSPAATQQDHPKTPTARMRTDAHGTNPAGGACS